MENISAHSIPHNRKLKKKFLSCQLTFYIGLLKVIWASVFLGKSGSHVPQFPPRILVLNVLWHCSLHFISIHWAFLLPSISKLPSLYSSNASVKPNSLFCESLTWPEWHWRVSLTSLVGLATIVMRWGSKMARHWSDAGTGYSTSLYLSSLTGEKRIMMLVTM